MPLVLGQWQHKVRANSDAKQPYSEVNHLKHQYGQSRADKRNVRRLHLHEDRKQLRFEAVSTILFYICPI